MPAATRRPYDATWRSAPVTKLSNRASLESRRHGNVGHNEMESRPVGSAWCGRVVVSVARGCTAGLSTDAETSFRRRRPPGGRRARLAEHYRRQSRRTHKPTKCSLRRADWRTLMSTPQVVVVVAAVFFGQIFPLLLLLLLKLSRTAEYVPLYQSSYQSPWTHAVSVMHSFSTRVHLYCIFIILYCIFIWCPVEWVGIFC